MANNKVTIDVEARLVDNVSDKVKKIQTKLDNTEKKKIKIDIDVKSAKTKTKKIEDDLDKLGKKKVKPKIDADDKNAQTKTKRVQSLLNRFKNTKTKARWGTHSGEYLETKFIWFLKIIFMSAYKLSQRH